MMKGKVRPVSISSRSQIVFNLIQSLSGAEEPRKLLDRILDAAVKMTGATTGSIILIDKATSSLSIEAARGFADRTVKATRLKVGRGITGWVAAKGRTCRVDDVRLDRRYISLKKEIRSELAAPLVLDGEVIGVINVDSTRIAAFSEDDEKAIETLATLSSRVIADALIHDRLKKRSRQLEALVRIGGELTSLVSPEGILHEVTAAAADLAAARLVTVRLLDDAGKNLVLAARHGGSAQYEKLPPVPVVGSALGGVATSRIPLIIENIEKDTSYKFKDVAREEGLASMLAVPLHTAERSLGVLVIYRDRPGDFEEDAVTMSVGLAGLAAAALENARLFKNVIESDKRARRVEMKNAAREMGAELAHQIRNPLTVVRLLVASEGKSGDTTAMNASDREVALRELKRVDELIARLLGNAAREQERFESIDLDRLVEEVTVIAKVRAAGRNVRIQRHEGLGTIRGDRAEIWQVLSYILDNAVQAAARVVSVRGHEDPKSAGAVEILIEDDGPGVPEGVNVFEPLVTTKPDGVGIGLFSARRIVLEHGGEIGHSRSRRLGGACFRVLLPRESHGRIS